MNIEESTAKIDCTWRNWNRVKAIFKIDLKQKSNARYWWLSARRWIAGMSFSAHGYHNPTSAQKGTRFWFFKNEIRDEAPRRQTETSCQDHKKFQIFNSNMFQTWKREPNVRLIDANHFFQTNSQSKVKTGCTKEIAENGLISRQWHFALSTEEKHQQTKESNTPRFFSSLGLFLLLWFSGQK